MTDDVLIIAAAVVVLALPGLAGYAAVAWRNRSTPDPASPWAGWLVGAGGTTAFFGACYLFAVGQERMSGMDDGSVPASLTGVLASVVVNAVAAVVLGWSRRLRREKP